MSRPTLRKRFVSLTGLLAIFAALLWWGRMDPPVEPSVAAAEPTRAVVRPLRLDPPPLIPPRLTHTDTAAPLPVEVLTVYVGYPTDIGGNPLEQASLMRLWPGPDEAPWPHEDLAHAFTCFMCAMDHDYEPESPACDAWCETDELLAPIVASAEAAHMEAVGPDSDPWEQAQAALASYFVTLSGDPVIEGRGLWDFGKWDQEDAMARAEHLVQEHPDHPAASLARTLLVHLHSDDLNIHQDPVEALEQASELLRAGATEAEEAYVLAWAPYNASELSDLDTPPEAWFEQTAHYPAALRSQVDASLALNALPDDPAWAQRWMERADASRPLPGPDVLDPLLPLRGRLAEAGYGPPATWRASLANEAWSCDQLAPHGERPAMTTTWTGDSWTPLEPMGSAPIPEVIAGCLADALATHPAPHPLELQLSYVRYP